MDIMVIALSDDDIIFGMSPSHDGICEQCGKERKVRRVKSVGSILSISSRGYFQLCYSCYPEHVKFHSRGRTYYAPKRES